MPSPVEAVSSRLVTDRSMVGLHVRSVFDAPRDPASANDSVGESAIAGAQKEYGVTGTDKLLKWRSASHWSNFVTRMAEMLREHATRYPPPLHPPLRFYLAADSAEAYEGLSARFGDAVKFTRRECGTARCDFPGGSSATLYQSIQKILSLPDETRIYVCHDYKAPGRDVFAWETTVGEQKARNVHVGAGKDQDSFVQLRDARDAQLSMPKLIIPSLQVNMRAGNMPQADENGDVYLKVPINKM